MAIGVTHGTQYELRGPEGTSLELGAALVALWMRGFDWPHLVSNKWPGGPYVLVRYGGASGAVELPAGWWVMSP